MSKSQQNARTVPAMPAAKKQRHVPTLVFRMPAEIKEEKEKEEERIRAGRYSLIRDLVPKADK